jgi:uncharacterized protein (TIGR03437 family)
MLNLSYLPLCCRSHLIHLKQRGGFLERTRQGRGPVNKRGSIVIIRQILNAAFATAVVCTALAAQTISTVPPAQPASHTGTVQLDRLSQARTNPSKAPATSLADAWAQRRALETQHTADFTLNAFGLVQPAPPANWLPLGPQGISSLAYGAQSGRINAITVDPNNPGRIYLAPAGGGVWRSDDSGNSWQATSNAMSSMSSGALVLDPRIGSQGTLYYGTGDFFSGISYGAGVFKSTDAGVTWQQMSLQFSGGFTFRVALHPTNPQTLFVARDSGIWRTSDGGNTWNNTLPATIGNNGTITDVAIDANTPTLVFAVLADLDGLQTNGVYRSLDGGSTWTLITALPFGAGVGRMTIAKTAASSQTVCVLVANINDTLNGLYRSDDSGGTWRSLAVPPGLFYNGSYSNGGYDQLLVMDPTSTSIIYAGGWELYRSSDGGQTWQTLSLNAQGQPVVHEGMFSMAFQAGQTGAFCLGTEGGVYLTIDRGLTWFNLNAALPIALINAVAIYPGGSQILAGGESVGVIDLTGQFSSWNQLLSGYVGSLFLDPVTATTFYAGQVQTSLYRSLDSGNDWSTINPPVVVPASEYYAPFIPDPNNAGNLLFGASQVWRSANQGASWSAVSPQLATNGDYFTALTIANGAPRTIGVTGGGLVFYSVDGATNWTPGTGLPPSLYLTGVAFDPQNPLKAYVTVWGFGNGHVYRTLDGGATWQNIGTANQLPDAPANAIVVDPRGPLYVATDVGVFRNVDGNSTWTSFNDGLPTTFITSLALDSASNTLVAGTYGRGAYQVALQAPSSNEPAIESLGIVDGASTSTVLAPGTTAVLYGTNLASGVAAASPVAGSLLQTTVAVNGVQAPLFYVSPTQINFQMPFQATNSQANVVVSTPNGSTAAYVQMAVAAPGIFSVSHANGTLVSAASPAAAGEVLIVTADGLGDTTPGSVTGATPPATPAPLLSTATATINGVAAPVQFAGIVGIGVDQVNVTVPTGVAGKVPLVIISAGRTSNLVTIVIQ